MRAIRILFYLGLLSFLSLLGLWYYSCERLASLIPQGSFEFEFGALGKMRGSVRIEDLSYTGLLDGQAGVRFKLRKVEATFEGAPWMPEPRTAVVSGVAWGTPIEYEISGALWGKSVGITMGQVDKFLWEQQSGGRPAVKFQMNFSGGGSRLDFRKAGLLLERPEHLRNVFSHWQGFLAETEEVSVLPLQGKVFLAGQREPLMLLDYGNTRVHYDMVGDHLLHLSGRLDLHAAYGKNFFQQIIEMQKGLGKLPQMPAEAEALLDAVQQAFLADAKFLARGDFEAEVPIDALAGSITDASKKPEAPPFSFGIEKFELEIPFILPSRRTVTGLVEFRRGKGSPLNLKLDQRIEGADAMKWVNILFDVIEKRPELLRNSLPLDFSKARKGTIESFAELEGFHGALVMLLRALKTYNDWILKEPSAINARLLVATPSKRLTPADLLGATVHFELDWGMAQGSGVSLVADAQGALQWKAAGKLRKFETSLKYCSEVLKIFLARAFLATFMNPEMSSPQAGEKEKAVVSFFLSDGLAQQLNAAIMRIVRKLDKESSSADDIEFELESRSGQVTYNGRSLAEITNTLSELGKVEAAQLAQYAAKELRATDADFANKLDSFQ